MLTNVSERVIDRFHILALFFWGLYHQTPSYHRLLHSLRGPSRYNSSYTTGLSHILLMAIFFYWVVNWVSYTLGLFSHNSKVLSASATGTIQFCYPLIIDIWVTLGTKKGRSLVIFGKIWSNFGFKKVLSVCNALLHLNILRLKDLISNI